MKVAVLDITGKETGRKVELSDAVFAIEPNNHAVYLDVKQYLAHQRQGTHKSKERAEIAGSTRKIKKQKGTGTARAGSIKSALTLKSKDNAIMVVEDFNFETPKTKDFKQFLKSLGLENKKSLIVLGDSNNNVYLSSRNLERSEVITNSELSTYKILTANNLVLLEGSLEGIESNLIK